MLSSLFVDNVNPTQERKANIFKSHFAKKLGKKTSEHLISSYRENFFDKIYVQYAYINQTRKRCDTMSNLNNKSSSGVDNINNILVKRTSVVTIRFIVLLINMSVSRSFSRATIESKGYSIT